MNLILISFFVCLNVNYWLMLDGLWLYSRKCYKWLFLNSFRNRNSISTVLKLVSIIYPKRNSFNFTLLTLEWHFWSPDQNAFLNDEFWSRSKANFSRNSFKISLHKYFSRSISCILDATKSEFWNRKRKARLKFSFIQCVSNTWPKFTSPEIWLLNVSCRTVFHV